MKYLLLTLFIGAIIITSCNNEQKKSTEPTLAADSAQKVENKIVKPSTSCYSSTKAKDTVTLNVRIFHNSATGKLLYKFHEKDGNEGEFDGQLHGDTLLANYTFRSEGKLSNRQVVFLIKDSVAIEGYGTMEYKEGKMIFKDLTQVSFGKGLILKKISCGEN